MKPLDPQLKELIRRARADSKTPTSPPPGFTATVLARRCPNEAGGPGAGLDFVLISAAALSTLVILVLGTTLAFQSNRRAAASVSWVSASQFAASRFMP